MDTEIESETTPDETQPTARRPEKRRLSCLYSAALGFVGLLIVLGVYALVVQSAIQSGQQLSLERAAGTRSAEIDKQIRLAATDIWSGRGELAVQRLGYVLTQTPRFPAIEATYRAAIITPSPTATPTPTPTTTPTPTPDPQDAFDEAEAAFRAGEWERAIAGLRRLQIVDQAYRANEVRQVLYAAYVSHGAELLEDARLEEGIRYLDLAEALWPLPAELIEQRDKASRYLRALTYWGVDWARAIKELELLTYGTIDYLDVFVRLIKAHVTYGNLWADREEWCPAELQYAGAVRLRYDAPVEEKRLEAARLCLMATPTPMPDTITDTLPIISPIAGLNVGRLAYTVYNPTNGLYDLMVIHAASPVPVRYYSHVGQPSWSWDGGRLVFKSWGEDGLLTMPAGGGAATYVLGLSASHPSFSPDGSRIAFSTRAYSQNPQIYVAPVDGSAGPQFLASGQYPVWGPTGWLAYSGCLPDGTTCGILIRNPDDGAPPARLTASLLDIPMSWSRDGANIAYMSTYSGNWDVYNVNIAGGVTLLTTNETVDGLPAWAPDGSGIAFLSDRDGSWGIYLMRPDGSEQRKIIDLGKQHHNWTAERISWGP